MILSRKVTGALAWGGLILILGVPSAEMLSANVASEAPAAPKATGSATPRTDSVQTASVTKTGDAVADFEATGRNMPDYISDPAPAPKRVLPATGTVAPAAATKPATVTAPASVDTASVPAAATPAPAPIPMPVRMRPLPPAPSSETASVPPVQQPTTVPAAQSAPVASPPAAAQAPVILDEQQVISREASAQPAVVPPADIPEPRVISEDELQEWDSGSLADYLERRGLMSDASNPPRAPSQSSASYEEDDDGFFLSDRPRRRSDGSFLVFPND